MRLKLFAFLTACLLLACTDDNSAEIEYFNSTAIIKEGTQIILSSRKSTIGDTITFEEDTRYKARITEHYNLKRTICSLKEINIKRENFSLQDINFTLEKNKMLAIGDISQTYIFYSNGGKVEATKKEYIINVTNGREHSWNDKGKANYSVEINGEIVFEIGDKISRE